MSSGYEKVVEDKPLMEFTNAAAVYCSLIFLRYRQSMNMGWQCVTKSILGNHHNHHYQPLNT